MARTFRIAVQFHGPSRSLPPGDEVFQETAPVEQAEVLVLAGENAGAALSSTNAAGKLAVLVELGTECLGVHTGEQRGTEGSNVLGLQSLPAG